jgi:CHAT domain-containing protein/tetratricopeptide (TPR) repeat protein
MDVSEVSQADQYLNSGKQCLEFGNYSIALNLFEQSIALNPDLAEAWEGKAATLRRLERHEEAIPASEKAIALLINVIQVVQNDAEFWLDQSNLQFAAGDFEGAIISCDKAVKVQPNYHEAWNNRGVALENLGCYEDAITSYSQAIKFKPDCYEAWLGSGAALQNLGQYEDAITNYNQAIKLKLDYYKAWIYRGMALLKLENFEEATANFENAIKLNPDDYVVWNNRGVALLKLESFEEALISFCNVIKLKPDYYIAWTNHGEALDSLDRNEEAIVSFDSAIKLKPDDEVAWTYRGNALGALGRYEEAIASFDKAIDLTPDNEKAWYGRGIVLGKLDRYEDAIASYDKVIKIQPHDCAVWNNRGVAISKLGRYEDVISNCDQGLTYVFKEAQPEGWGVLHHMKGKIYSHQAKLSQNSQTARLKNSQALECYEKALQTLEAFPEPYLDVIHSLIKIHLGLLNLDDANQLRIKGLEVFWELINTQSSPKKKRIIEAQFSGFSQVSVDTLVSAGNLTAALKAAERYKNRCLTWILDEWKEQVTSPSYAEMRELLNSNHEIIYWHLSEEILTTFILIPNQEIPNFLTQKSTRFESWQEDWDKRYGDYRIKSKDQAHHLASHPWRDTLKKELDRLKEILEIDKIESFLSPNTKLILIPHRDLHRFPIHALFGDERITTYLPSIQVGLAQKPPSTPPTRFLLNVEDPARPDQPPLQFARLESAIIQAMFAPNVKAINPEDGDRATVKTALQENRGIFHFTGHGDYNARQPEHSAIGLTDTDRLTAKEISALNLQQYELVCLSACETALTGRQTINTEYVGLTSAFLQAGVSQVLSTLWTVQEVSNAYLMIRFYQFLQNKMNPAEALKRSQSWLRAVTGLELADWLIEISQLKSLDLLIKQELEQQAYGLREEANASTIDLHHPPYADPYHWAAFTLTGRSFL